MGQDRCGPSQAIADEGHKQGLKLGCKQCHEKIKVLGTEEVQGDGRQTEAEWHGLASNENLMNVHIRSEM